MSGNRCNPSAGSINASIRSDEVPLQNISDLPDIFTTFRKSVEPLRERPRKQLPKPASLPPLPSKIPPCSTPFAIPNTLQELVSALLKPLKPSLGLEDPPRWPEGTKSAHPFCGGETHGHQRIKDLISSGGMTNYKDTRNGMLGTDFSTKLSAWLAFGCVTARQIHQYLLEFEDGTTDLGKTASGHGKGENKGTAAVRFELLWRDYMRLCTRKFGPRLFHVEGFRSDSSTRWKYLDGYFPPSSPTRRTAGDASVVTTTTMATTTSFDPSSGRGLATDTALVKTLQRFLSGHTGTGLIDASQRELFLTGYTSNRARQNVASFLSRHLEIDWRIGAEWYECLLVDHDVSSNWGNWQYVAGVGNDPRAAAAAAAGGNPGGRVFNPVKQALDYDPRGEYIAAWVPELRGAQRRALEVVEKAGAEAQENSQALMGVFQAWRLSREERAAHGLANVEWVERPLVMIAFSVGKGKGGDGKRGGSRGRGRGYRGRGRGHWQRRTGDEDRAIPVRNKEG